MSYNGWSNYETWRVNLEIFSDRNATDDYGIEYRDSIDFADFVKQLKSEAEELIIESAPQGLAQDYALAFLGDVDYLEIARAMIDDLPMRGDGTPAELDAPYGRCDDCGAPFDEEQMRYPALCDSCDAISKRGDI